MSDFLDLARIAKQKREVKKEKKEFKNPFGESWQQEYTHKDRCMICMKEREFISKYNGTCVVCDDVMTEEEYQKTIKKIDKRDLFNNIDDNMKRIAKKKEDNKKLTSVQSFDFGKETKKKSTTTKKKEEIIEIKNDFKFSEYPIIALVWGYDGTSKSEQIMKFEPKDKTIIFDLEDKLRPLASKLGFPQENIINAKKYNAKYDVSGPETLQGIRDILNEIKKCKRERKGKFKDVNAIGFDGVSDIRKPYAVMEWLKEHPDRQKPMNWGDWGEINDKVRDICFSMINMGLVTNVSIFFTAQIDFKDDAEIPNCKPWIWHNIQHKFKMTRDDVNHRFYAYCEKSHHDPFWTADLTDFTHKEKLSLFNILQDPKLVEQYKEDFEKEQTEIAEKKLNGKNAFNF